QHADRGRAEHLDDRRVLPALVLEGHGLHREFARAVAGGGRGDDAARADGGRGGGGGRRRGRWGGGGGSRAGAGGGTGRHALQGRVAADGLLRRALEEHPALVHHDRAVAEAADLLQVVRDEEHRRAL